MKPMATGIMGIIINTRTQEVCRTRAMYLKSSKNISLSKVSKRVSTPSFSRYQTQPF